MSSQPKKRTVIQFIVTAAEKRAMMDAASEVQFSLSHWLRKRAFYNKVVQPASDPHNGLTQRAKAS